jgi:hypothetical protein
MKRIVLSILATAISTLILWEDTRGGAGPIAAGPPTPQDAGAVQGDKAQRPPPLENKGTSERPQKPGVDATPQDPNLQRVGPAETGAWKTGRVKSIAADPGYGFSREKPIKVGLSTARDFRNEDRYLSQLRGAKGEPVSYRRVGSCCGFTTPNAIVGSNGLLDIFEVNVAGSPTKKTLYFNAYDFEEPKAPVGFTFTIDAP